MVAPMDVITPSLKICILILDMIDNNRALEAGLKPFENITKAVQAALTSQQSQVFSASTLGEGGLQ